MPVLSPSCYDLLGVPVDAGRDELGHAWRQRRDDALHRRHELPEHDVEALLGRIDEAFAVLSNPHRARLYKRYREQGVPRSIEELAELPPPQTLSVPSAEWGEDPDATATQAAAPSWERSAPDALGPAEGERVVLDGLDATEDEDEDVGPDSNTVPGAAVPTPGPEAVRRRLEVAAARGLVPLGFEPVRSSASRQAAALEPERAPWERGPGADTEPPPWQR